MVTVEGAGETVGLFEELARVLTSDETVDEEEDNSAMDTVDDSLALANDR
jgi:hypothetical protein